MLNPSNDRLDYGEILAPKVGYKLDFAVGTTYSLDLDALVGASLALGLSEETDSALMNNPVCLLEALRSTGDKVALFCEGGQIHMPNKVTPLYILLEKMVFSVNTVKHRGMSAYPSFHPKFWLIRYKNDNGDVYYRVVVLSRNLTFDRSWDVTYYMDGYVAKRTTDANEPLCDFLRYLLTHVQRDENGKSKAREIRNLIKELPYIAFEPSEKEFYEYEFIPNGIKDSEGDYYAMEFSDLLTETFHEIMIISPFVSSDIIRDFNDRNMFSPIKDPRYMLITREMSLGKLKEEDVSNFSIYTLRDTVVDGETSISEDAESIKKQDIHAKVYMMRKYSTTDLYVGSMNASHNAVYGNIEFMLRLAAKNRHLNMDKLKESLFAGEEDNDDNPFQQVTLKNAIISEESDKTNMFTSIIKEINRSGAIAIIDSDDDEYYSINVWFGECELRECQVTVRPLLSNKTEEFATSITFEKLTITQLSEFYVLSVSDGESKIERVIIINTEGLPDDREKAVVSTVVSDRDCFYRYIAFLLGDDTILSALESNTVGESGEAKNNYKTYRIPALYEKMLQIAAINPDKFRGIEYLMKTISEDGIIPEDFQKLYETFKKAVKFNG
ncbi:MAG: hypothetical protein K5656_12020 [Lachnospiraceae bacterium]|nr:hypothetical protein [Lachnospiraceae bacterium]